MTGRPGRRWAGSAFLILWMTFWLSAILVAVWTMGEAALSGEPGAAIVLLVWVGAALFGLVSAARSLKATLLGERKVRKPYRNHHWNDGLDTGRDTDESVPPPPPPSDAGDRGPRS